MSNIDMLKGRNLLIVTKHNKESVISPLLEKELSVNCTVTLDFDTDRFGTFTGETIRKDSAFNTVRNKCLEAMSAFNFDLAIASEGSFGSHPFIPFVPCDDELIILIDKKNNLEICARELSTYTNFSSAIISSENELNNFAESAKFPSHALILKSNKDQSKFLAKGITEWSVLLNCFNQLLVEHGSAYLETDMRAMYNPSRMMVIESATQKLIQKIKLQCPICSTPGFDVVYFNKGLPCKLCNFPTQSILSQVNQCQKCKYQQIENFPENKETEDPMFCDICNP